MLLTREAIRQIEDILRSGKSVEIAIRNGKLIVWAVTSKKRYETTVV